MEKIVQSRFKRKHKEIWNNVKGAKNAVKENRVITDSNLLQIKQL